MKEVKRYDIYMHSDDVQFLRECPEGDYVRFGDFDSIVKELEGKLEVAAEALEAVATKRKESVAGIVWKLKRTSEMSAVAWHALSVIWSVPELAQIAAPKIGDIP